MTITPEYILPISNAKTNMNMSQPAGFETADPAMYNYFFVSNAGGEDVTVSGTIQDLRMNVNDLVLVYDGTDATFYKVSAVTADGTGSVTLVAL